MKITIALFFVFIYCTNHLSAQVDKTKNEPQFNKMLICPFEKGMGLEPTEPYRWDQPDMKIIMVSKTDTVVRSCMDAKVSLIQPAEDGSYELVIYYKEYYFWYTGLGKVWVKKNQNIKAGEILGIYTPGHELEFRMFNNEEPMDPRRYLQCTVPVEE
jgi:hypothetical protein